MDLEQLRQIDVIARCGTLSAASKVLHTSQPALSRSIQRLEVELGQELFSRTKNHIELNEAGVIAVEHARAILREERVLRDDLDRLAQRSRTLLVGTVAPAPVWHLTARTVERFPGTILQPVTLEADEVERQLVDGDLDLAVTLVPMDVPTCKAVPLLHEELYVSLDASHPLANRKSVSFDVLDGETFLVDASAGFWIDMVRRRMPHARIIEQPDRRVLSQLVLTTDLPTFATNITREWDERNGRTLVPLEDDEAKVTFYLNMREGSSELVSDIFDWVNK